MVYIHPRPFLIGVAAFPLANAREWFVRSIPTGASWRFLFLLVDYHRSVEVATQITPDLSYRLYDADGRAFHVDPVLLPQVTSPAGGPTLDASFPLGIDYPGGSSLKLEITGQIPGVGPAAISITCFGIRGWQKSGG
jgi:hypothetical protein